MNCLTLRSNYGWDDGLLSADVLNLLRAVGVVEACIIIGFITEACNGCIAVVATYELRL